MSIFSHAGRVRSTLLGQARNISDPSIFHQMSLIAFFAWVGLGADGITSSCYGPEEAFLALGKHPSLSIFLVLATVFTIFIISASYRQIIELFPAGGGGYLVASKLLSPVWGMISGSALLIDYLLTITLSVASGADALFSFLPAAWYPYRLDVAVLGVILLIWLNLRGVKESVMPLVPVFLLFIVTHAVVIVYSFSLHAADIPAAAGRIGADTSASLQELGLAGVLLLLMRAYSLGAGTFTGIEAVSNGIPILREPRVRTAKRTMTCMAVSLAFMAGGLMLAYLLCGVSHTPGKTLNAVLVEGLTGSWGSAGYGFLLMTLLSEAALLMVAAQTGFLDGPRVLASMAMDRWMPARFSSLNDRLVTQNGVLILGLGAIGLMLYSHGSVKFLVVLYSINVFITFTLSQTGMVRHWWTNRYRESRWLPKLIINGIGLLLSAIILVSVAVIKFHEGGWLTIVITGALVLLALGVKRHYRQTARMLARLDGLMKVTKNGDAHPARRLRILETAKTVVPGQPVRTAVLFVNGFNGNGLHTLFSIIRLFGNLYQRFIFVQIGLVDSGVFKGEGELEKLREHARQETAKYTEYMQRHGFSAEAVTSVAVDVVEEAVMLARQVRTKHPDAVFFAGQLVFHEDTILTRWLHNYTAFAIQRRFYHDGLPVLIMPVKL